MQFSQPTPPWLFADMIEDMYHCRNPYHNAMHAADVAQAMYCYLLEEKVSFGLAELWAK